MADTVDTVVLFNGTRKYAVRLLGISDSTGETNVTKVDISTLVGPNGLPPTSVAIEEIKWDVQGFSSVLLKWDHTTDDEIMVCAGTGLMSYSSVGGLRDPESSGGTGDILLTSNGAAAGATYDITLLLRLKA